MIEWRLYIGKRLTDVSVCQDAKYPNMWRIHRGSEQSDMVNLTRAKDAAPSWARSRGLGGSETVRWERRELAQAAE